MLRVFVDTSVLFAAVYSASGSASDLMKLAADGLIRLIVSPSILVEVERNILKKLPHGLGYYQRLIFAINAELANELNSEITTKVAEYVVQKDVHVIAAAIAAQPDYLVTYDRKHLLDVPEVTVRSGLKIVTPDVIVKLLEDQG